MKDIEAFVRDFIAIEAQVITQRKGSSLVAFNQSIAAARPLLAEALIRDFDFVEMDEFEHEFYQDETAEPALPRHLFKISQYQHPMHGNVWVIFLSPAEADADFRILTDLFFVVENDNGLQVANKANYSDFSSGGDYYQWEYGSGADELKFDALEGPIEVVRFEAPMDINNGLKHFEDAL